MAASRFEVGQVERTQAALEAVTLLDEAGFVVDDFDVETEQEDVTFDLDLTLAVAQDERPLAVLE